MLFFFIGMNEREVYVYLSLPISILVLHFRRSNFLRRLNSIGYQIEMYKFPILPFFNLNSYKDKDKH
jgi:hypothetical protein